MSISLSLDGAISTRKPLNDLPPRHAPVPCWYKENDPPRWGHKPTHLKAHKKKALMGNDACTRIWSKIYGTIIAHIMEGSAANSRSFTVCFGVQRILDPACWELETVCVCRLERLRVGGITSIAVGSRTAHKAAV